MMWNRARHDKAEEWSDVALINRLSDGSKLAFSEFYRRFGILIMRHIRGMTRDKPRLEPDDLLQEFFLKLQATAYRDLNLWNRQTPLPLFLRHIVRNFVIDRWRADPTSPGRRRQTAVTPGDRQEPATGRVRFESVDDLWERDAEAEKDLRPDPADVLEARELRRQGLTAWARLTSDRDRRLVCGKFHRDIPADEACAREGLSSGAYRKAIFDAQKRLLGHLRALAPEFFP